MTLLHDRNPHLGVWRPAGLGRAVRGAIDRQPITLCLAEQDCRDAANVEEDAVTNAAGVGESGRSWSCNGARRTDGGLLLGWVENDSPPQQQSSGPSRCLVVMSQTGERHYCPALLHGAPRRAIFKAGASGEAHGCRRGGPTFARAGGYRGVGSRRPRCTRRHKGVRGRGVKGGASSPGAHASGAVGVGAARAGARPRPWSQSETLTHSSR